MSCSSRFIARAAGLRRRVFSSPQWIVAAVCLLVTFLPRLAWATDEGAPPFYDGRLEGYGLSHTTLDAGGTIFLWVIFALLAVLGLAVLFKSANRSHLD
jgi:hypothetical protein